MSKYDITYRKLLSYTMHHANVVRKINPNFCLHSPYFINVELGDDIRTLICDGEYIIPVTWNGRGMELSEEVKPSDRVLRLIHLELFDVDVI